MPLVHLPINTVAFERLCIPARGVPRLRRGRNWASICRSRTFQVRGAPRAWRNGSAEVGIGIQSVAHVPSRYAGLLAPGETAPPRSELGFNRGAVTLSVRTLFPVRSTKCTGVLLPGA